MRRWRWWEAGLPRVQGDDISFEGSERRGSSARGGQAEETRQKETNKERSQENQGEGKREEQKITFKLKKNIKKN